MKHFFMALFILWSHTLSATSFDELDDVKKGRILFEHRQKIDTIKLLLPLAESGDAEAQLWVGLSMRYAWASEFNISDEYKWLLASAQQGNPYAMYHLPDYTGCRDSARGAFASCPEGIDEWRKKALERFCELGAEGDIEAAFYCQALTPSIWHYVRFFGRDRFAERFRPLADKGSVDAMMMLSEIYGKDETDDYKEARYWTQRAAQAGNGHAAYVHSYIDESEAENLKSLKKSARLGSISLINILAYLLREGIGGDPDPKEAYFYESLLPQQFRSLNRDLAKTFSEDEKALLEKRRKEWLSKHHTSTFAHKLRPWADYPTYEFKPVW